MTALHDVAISTVPAVNFYNRYRYR